MSVGGVHPSARQTGSGRKTSIAAPAISAARRYRLLVPAKISIATCRFTIVTWTSTERPRANDRVRCRDGRHLFHACRPAGIPDLRERLLFGLARIEARQRRPRKVWVDSAAELDWQTVVPNRQAAGSNGDRCPRSAPDLTETETLRDRRVSATPTTTGPPAPPSGDSPSGNGRAAPIATAIRPEGGDTLQDQRFSVDSRPKRHRPPYHLREPIVIEEETLNLTGDFFNADSNRERGEDCRRAEPDQGAGEGHRRQHVQADRQGGEGRRGDEHPHSAI